MGHHVNMGVTGSHFEDSKKGGSQDATMRIPKKVSKAILI